MGNGVVSVTNVGERTFGVVWDMGGIFGRARENLTRMDNWGILKSHVCNSYELNFRFFQRGEQ